MGSPRLAHAAVACLCAFAACTDGSDPLAPPNPEPRPGLSLAVTCTVDRRGPTVSCGGPAPGAGVRPLIVGGQGTYTQLTSSNLTAEGDTVSFDVTVQNLTAQALGTADGVTPDADGVRIFFHRAPASTGAGQAVVANPDGTATFTETQQPYFQYDEVVAPSQTSAAKRWRLAIDPGVVSVTFQVYVSAAVRFPTGWIDVAGGGNVVAGASQPLTPTVRSAVGNALPGETVSWGSSDTTVATVDGAGNVTAVAPGTATLTATAGSRSGSVAVKVCPDLAVGGVYAAVMPLASDLCFAGGASGAAEYTYMPVNLSSASSLSLTVTGTGIQAVTGPPSPNRVAAGGPRLDPSPAADDPGHLARLAAGARDAAPLLGRAGARLRPRAATRGPRGPRALIVPGVPTVGDLWDLNVASGCSGATDLRTGRVASVGQHAVIVADTTNPPGGFTTAQYDSIALEFDSIAYPVDSAAFGAPTDLDTNGRVVLFFTRAVNELSPPASSVVTTAYFASRDLFSAAGGCPRSNEGEMLYLLVPDPTGVVNSNVRTVSFVRGGVIRAAGHELQHLTNAWRRTYVHSAPLEEAWLDEALSGVAEELMFYRTSAGLAPRGNIVVTQLTTGPNATRRVASFNTYANPNFGKLRSWLQRPDTTGALRTSSAASLAFQGVGWAFLRYASDRVNGSEDAFWSSLVNTPLTGKANLQAAIGADPDAWLRDFVAATYADDAVAGVAAAYTHPSWSFRSIYTALNGSYQLVPRSLIDATGLTLSYSRSGGTAYARFGVPQSGFATVTALSGGVAPTSPYALIVVRTK